jgi:hypothetical protein
MFIFLSSRTRWFGDGASIPLPECKLIWKAWALLRVKIFLWLAFKRMHRTGDRRARHGLEAREMCYLCDQARETIDHILAAPHSLSYHDWLVEEIARWV